MSAPQPVDAATYFNQLMALYMNDGNPPMGEGSTDLDGKTVRHIGSPGITGTVVGPSQIPDFAWVRWDDQPEDQIGLGLHRISELKEVDP